MSESNKNDFHFQTAGSLVAMRIVLASLLKEHPDPEKLRKTINDLAETSGARGESFPAPIRENFESILQEMVSHLDVRITS